MADNLARSRPISPSDIRGMLDKGHSAAKEVPSSDEAPLKERADPLPRPGEPYRANARHSNGLETTLHFVSKDFAFEGFSYADLERVRLVPGEKPGSGPVLIVRFHGSVVTEIRLEGRHLQGLYHWIGLHGLSWVWEHPATPDFCDDDTPIIKRMVIDQIDR